MSYIWLSFCLISYCSYSHLPLQQAFLYEKKLPFQAPEPVTPPVGAIVGGVFGGLVLVACACICAVVVIICYRKSRGAGLPILETDKNAASKLLP